MAGRAHTAPVTHRGRASLDHLLQRARTDLIGNPRQALSAANAAVARADAGNDPQHRAAARQVRGDALRFLGQHEAALTDYSSAGELFRRLGQPADAARSEASAVDSLRCLGRGAQALRLAQRTRRLLQRLGGEQLRSAVLDEIVGLVYLQQNDYARALRQFDRARPTIAALGRSIDLAALNNNAATALTNLDRLREAETLYTSARAVYAEQGTDAALARVDVNLGNLALRQGRYGAALDLLRSAADVFDSLRNLPRAINARLDLVETYLALNLLDEAGALSQQQLDLARQVGLQHEHARALFYLSTQRGRLGWLDDALDGLVHAEREFAEAGNVVWRTRCAIARAVLLLARAQPETIGQAASVARQAARVFSRLGLPTHHALAQALVAHASLRAGRYRTAEEQARAAVWTAQAVGVPWLVFESQYLLGRALRARGESAAAYVAYREAADALERVRSELQPEELRVSLVSDKTDLYQELVLVCLDRLAVEEALQHAERAKSRAFAERLAGSIDAGLAAADAHVVGTSDARTLERMRQLRDELVWLYSRLAETEATSVLPRLRRKVQADEAELVRLQRRLQPASRERAAALGIGGATLEAAASIANVRRQLQPGTVVLEYFQAGDEFVLFVFDAVRLAAYRLGPVERVVRMVDRLRFQISKFGLGAEYVGAHARAMLVNANQVLGDLYTALIAPAADDVAGAGRLLVIPHGPLHYVPFHALMDPHGAPLVDNVEIASVPSAAVLASRLQRPPLPDRLGQRLLIGVTDAAIPQVGRELEVVGRLFNPSVVLADEMANEEAFRRYAPEADVMHIASHALFRHDNPLFSAIRLSDGWLSLYDLYGMRLRAALVTLSACETGVSDVLAGDELVGLARGFLQAGAASVVVSLWAVNDASTARLMEHFYTHLEAGLGAAAAMRQAQIDQRREYPHPFHWAPFMVVGRP